MSQATFLKWPDDQINFVKGLGVLKGEAGMLWLTCLAPPTLDCIRNTGGSCANPQGHNCCTFVFKSTKWWQKIFLHKMESPTGISITAVFSSSFACLLFSVIMMYWLFFKTTKTFLSKQRRRKTIRWQWCQAICCRL